MDYRTALQAESSDVRVESNYYCLALTSEGPATEHSADPALELPWSAGRRRDGRRRWCECPGAVKSEKCSGKSDWQREYEQRDGVCELIGLFEHLAHYHSRNKNT